MRKLNKLTKSERRALYALQCKVELLRVHFESFDAQLHYGNGTVSDVLSCVSAYLETISQELDDLPF